VTPPSPAPSPPADRDRDAVMGTDYAGAVEHYTSPSRRDAVKQRWEEPDLIALLDRAIDAAAPTGATGAAPLRVLDIGCGPGTVLDLLLRAPAAAARTIEYLGVDLDADLLDVARERHAERRGAAFVTGDVRVGLPAGDHDLVVSSGVPYSHLTVEELQRVAVHLFAHAHRRPGPTVLIVDVLGRYSLEWTDRWARRRWDYRMSFFAMDGEVPHAPMTTHGGTELRAILVDAATEAGIGEFDIALHDRSLVVGRHTSTGDYTPGLRPYRDLVNRLYDPALSTDLGLLRLDVTIPDAPDEVRAWHGELRTRWNDTLERARSAARDVEASTVAAVIEPALADELHALERALDRGLGVGHSLTAVVTIP
jgi:SAM-dependent methyltransferase